MKTGRSIKRDIFHGNIYSTLTTPLHAYLWDKHISRNPIYFCVNELDSSSSIFFHGDILFKFKVWGSYYENR